MGRSCGGLEVLVQELVVRRVDAVLLQELTGVNLREHGVSRHGHTRKAQAGRLSTVSFGGPKSHSSKWDKVPLTTPLNNTEVSQGLCEQVSEETERGRGPFLERKVCTRGSRTTRPGQSPGFSSEERADGTLRCTKKSLAKSFDVLNRRGRCEDAFEQKRNTRSMMRHASWLPSQT